MTTPCQPERLPRGVESWNDWREMYDGHRRDFIEEKILSTRYRALLSLLGFTPIDIEAEITEGFKERRKWRLANERSKSGE